ncbi:MULTISPECIES: acyl-CoA thioesterase [unclassified Prosthecochloris]|uniref:acyl-CoA thioesterase n=1 Tax=unclassified Prosthecochloris TaxID=2632826 RepID=UPI00223D687A|nr:MULTISPECIES: acyl-CoA thioesterase [unclassified Prosthecochloris]UZJ37754.1 acyl-CoA thioesterase [Prosthecochloris sp. SCSIO W1103]UZJ41565.1 acyl-CoA thioesterase [Prosthecochloris sp. SCSIO W1101]
MQSYNFTLPMSVRDYECDMQGIVNNSVYQNYLEHARHEYLKAVGMDFKMYAQEGINLVVVRAELDYKFPLESGDRFFVGVNMVRESRLKFAFYQDIFREKDKKLILKAKITGTALNQRGRPAIPEELDAALERISTTIIA